MSHLTFNRFPSSKVIVLIMSKHSGQKLGVIEWYSSWKRFIHKPENGTIWSDDCIDEVSAYIKLLTKEKQEKDSKKAELKNESEVKE